MRTTVSPSPDSKELLRLAIQVLSAEMKIETELKEAKSEEERKSCINYWKELRSRESR